MSQPSSLRADIQGLRAFAVIVVILEHLFHRPRGGFVGVDVFFVISGYLITSHLLRELERTERLSLWAFYRARIRRIVPAATVVIVFTVGFAALVLTRNRAREVALDGVCAFFFGANWRSMAIGTDYFQLGQLPSPLQHYWSLSVEEQFYFVWPLLSATVFTAALRNWRAAAAARRAVAAAFALVLVVSFAWALRETMTAPTVAYFSTFSRAWELAIGAWLAASAMEKWSPPLWLRVALGWLGLAGLFFSVWWINAESPFPAPAAALPVLSTVAVITAGIGVTSARYDRALVLLTNRVSGYLGDISYSLYLWHIPVVVLSASFLAVDSRAYYVLAIVVTLVLSVLSYHFIEQPVRRSKWLMPEHTRRDTQVAIAVAVALLAISGGAALRLTSASVEPTFSRARACFGAAAAPGACGACATEHPVRVDAVWPTLDDLPRDTARGYSCWRDEHGPLKTCRFGSKASDAFKVALVGDSHAAAVLPIFLERVDELGWQLDTFTGYGCQWRDFPEGNDCDAVADEVQQRLLEGHYDLVITTSARWATKGAPVESFATRWAAVAATGAKVVVLVAVPIVDPAAFACVSRVGADVSECATPVEKAFAIDDVQRAAAAQSGARVVDMTDFYCTERECPAVIGHVIVYRDSAGHLSATYLKSMAPYLLERLQQSIN